MGLGWGEPLTAAAGFAVEFTPDLAGAEQVAHGLLELGLR